MDTWNPVIAETYIKHVPAWQAALWLVGGVAITLGVIFLVTVMLSRWRKFREADPRRTIARAGDERRHDRGMRGRQASENPYQSETAEHKEWEHCRAMAAHCALAGMTVAA